MSKCYGFSEPLRHRSYANSGNGNCQGQIKEVTSLNRSVDIVGQSTEDPGSVDRHVGVAALEKAIEILSAFDSPLRTRGISELAAELDLPKSTVHRILATFTASEWVEKLPNGRYRLGVRVFELGSIVVRQRRVASTSLPFLHELYHQSHQSVFLTVLAGEEILHLEHIPAPGERASTATLGERWILHTSSAGKLFLAYSSAEFVDSYIAHGLRPMTPFSIAAPSVLRQELERIRGVGYATAVDEGVIGTSGLSAGISDRQGEIVAAVCMASQGNTILRYSTAIVDTANKISRQLLKH
jgi:DNA-binding IclR family transcriptional regulator